MSLLKKIAVGALATVGVLAVKNRKAIAKEVKTDLRRAKGAAKTVKRKVTKQVSAKKRSAATKRTKTRK
ncbi:MAG TPA: hypothetical protein VGO00_13570 [Kofleriaceae bacterium]|jgi:hypothetical protein|nr:hypothetical protein [Kofleriaceae bacterium]